MLIKTFIVCSICLASFAALSTTTPINKTATTQMATKTYNAKGKLVQKTTSNGRHYNAQGQYIGKTTQQGRHYDAKGRYTGKTMTTGSVTRTVDAKGKPVQQTKKPR